MKIKQRYLKTLQASARKKSIAFSLQSKSANEIAAEIKTASDGFLLTTEWKELREKVIAKYGCRCMKCKKLPKTIRDVNVDHIKPRKFHPSLSLDFDNLQVLCSTCNKAKGNKYETDYRPVNPS